MFIYAASRKIGAPQELADSIASYQLVPNRIVNLVALGLPLFEFTCGLLLLSGYFCAIGLLGIIGMLVLFLAALLSAVFRGLPVDCGCFGAQSWLDANPGVSLARDGVLLLGALFAYRHCVALEMAAQEKNNKMASSAATL
jgi:uncharacterized membrane protein YphA (DoxX/SURF4 family)